MRKRIKKRYSIQKIMLVFLLLAVVCGGFLFERHLGLVVTDMARYRCNLSAARVLSDSVTQVMEGTGDDPILLVGRSLSGDVTSIETDIRQANLLQAELMAAITDGLRGLSEETLKIPVGTLLGGYVMTGHGPEISFRFQPEGALTVRLLSRFESGGVNQTRHQILLSVEAQMLAVTSVRTVSVVVPAEFILAETVIVGAVPENFTQVLTEDRELLGDINDYKAEKP